MGPPSKSNTSNISNPREVRPQQPYNQQQPYQQPNDFQQQTNSFPQPQSNFQQQPNSFPQPQSNFQQQANSFAQPQSVRPRPRPSEHDERQPQQDTNDETDGSRSTHVDVNVHYRSVESASVADVNNSTPGIFTSFIIDRMENEGYDIPPSLESRRNLDRESEIARNLRRIGDDISRDKALNSLIGGITVTPNTVYETFFSVASEIFQDGSVNWGRVVMLFYFAYKLAIQVVSQGQLIDKIIEWVAKFVTERLASWISSRGGWTAVREYFGSTSAQLIGVFLAGIFISSLFWYYKR